jgi:hypothetical protein
MTDRELLELAAKAAGYTLGPEWDCHELGIWVNGKGNGDGFLFDPLTDDGDALRLAVILGLFEEPHISLSASQIKSGCLFSDYRLAIVRAAAEIGKAMP